MSYFTLTVVNSAAMQWSNATQKSILAESVRKFHEILIEKTCHGIQFSSNKAADIKNRWEKRLTEKLGPYVLKQSEDVVEVVGDNLTEFEALPNTTSRNLLLEPICPTVVNQTSHGLPKPKIKLSVPRSFEKIISKQSKSTQMERVVDTSEARPAKRQRLPRETSTETNKIIISSMENEPVIPGMKLYVHLSSYSTQHDNISEVVDSNGICAVRVLRIFGERLSGLSTTRTKVLLRTSAGHELTIDWPPYAACTNKEQLIAHFEFVRKNQLIETSNPSIDDEKFRSNTSDLRDYQHDTINYMVNTVLRNSSEGSHVQENSLFPSDTNGDISFAQSLLHDFDDFEWNALPIFENEGIQSNKPPNDGTVEANNVNHDIDRVLLTSGEMLSRSIVEEVERYYDRRFRRCPKFSIHLSEEKKYSDYSETSESSTFLHQEDDPHSLLPPSQQVLIGKASKVVRGESEFFVVLKDVYVHYPVGNSTNSGSTHIIQTDMILPEVTVRLTSNHLFGKL